MSQEDKTTLVIEATDDGVQIGLQCSEKLDMDNLSVTQQLGLLAVYEVRDAIRKHYPVKDEQVLKVPSVTH
ncbi:MAG: hypothetical protein R3175_07380 [Marinobacter sp.]|uniref:hypothetical protein n=1 Tax=Marinobacter sp. TaxID=50741 RepID=UPI00299CF453|nr:hypothetical protein [Marinobacter sp.]MDX1755862.1 hypothetical protein [Marinobacter sp.]